jgi:hypothetical protein
MVDDPVCEGRACLSTLSKANAANDSPNRKHVSTVIVIVLQTIFLNDNRLYEI